MPEVDVMYALGLEYHDVFDGNDPDSSGFSGSGPASYKISLATFRKHLAAIAEREPHVVSVVDWLQAQDKSTPLFLTFDDGGCSASRSVADALEAYGWHGHFLVTAGQIGTRTFLSGSAIRDLHSRGHTIGTHSLSHPMMMGALSRDEILREWQQSITVLAEILGHPILVGSVPGGFYTTRVGETAAKAGLKALFTSAPTTRIARSDGCAILGRYTLRSWSTAQTAAKLAAGYVLPRAGQWVLYRSLSAIRSLAGDNYTRLRQKFWSRRA